MNFHFLKYESLGQHLYKLKNKRKREEKQKNNNNNNKLRKSVILTEDVPGPSPAASTILGLEPAHVVN